MDTTRPREKLAATGAASLSDMELLAVLLGTGAPGKPVTELAAGLLREFGGLRGLLRAGPGTLKRQAGLGPAKAGKLLAVLELSRRHLAEELERGKAL